MKDLKDLRAKITPEAHCVLEAESRVSGKDHAEIVREVLHEWALHKISVTDCLRDLLLAEGLRK